MFADCSCLPPPFWDLGRNTRDIFEQNYVCGTMALRGKTKSPIGIDFKAGGLYCARGGAAEAFLESSYYWKDYKMNFSEKWSTDNSLFSDMTVSDLFVKGGSMGLGSQFSIENGGKKLFFKSGYEMELFNANMDIKIDPPHYLIRGSIVSSILGWIAGAQVIFDIGQKKMVNNSFSLGYYAPGFILHSNVTDCQEFTASIFQKLNGNLKTGIQMAWTTTSNATRMGFACVYEMDEITTYRGKIDNHSQLGIGFSHRFNRGVLMNIAACIDGKNFSCGNHMAGIGFDLEA